MAGLWAVAGRRGGNGLGEATADAGVVEIVLPVDIPADQTLPGDEEGVGAIGAGVEEVGAGGVGAGGEEMHLTAGDVVLVGVGLTVGVFVQEPLLRQKERD